MGELILLEKMMETVYTLTKRRILRYNDLPPPAATAGAAITTGGL
jgi:hypothetical protein